MIHYLTLKGDIKVKVRPVDASDGTRLQQGLKALSPTSRYQRFFFPKHCFSQSEIEYLTHSNDAHLTLGMISLKEGQESEALAVARYARHKHPSHVAEMAIVVADDWHRKGVGKVMIRILAQASLEAGITHWQAFYLSHNTGIKKLLLTCSSKESEKSEGQGVSMGIYKLKADIGQSSA